MNEHSNNKFIILMFSYFNMTLLNFESITFNLTFTFTLILTPLNTLSLSKIFFNFIPKLSTKSQI